MIYLRNNKIELGISLGQGGRAMILRRIGAENVLTSDTNAVLTDEQKQNFDKGPWIDMNGGIIWIGPQCDFWAHQDVNAEFKESKSQWPPDPYIIFSEYKVIEQTAEKLVIQSPKSPVTGLQLVKTFTLEGDKVTVDVLATNISDSEKSWDIWYNNRMDGFAKCYVPVADSADLVMDAPAIAGRGTIPYTAENGFFSFNPENPSGEFTLSDSKAYIYPESGFIVGFDEGQALFLSFEKHAREEIHPKQALVEIYNRTSIDWETCNLLELEYHAPYKTLQPGEGMSATQVWTVKAYTGEASDSSRIDFIKKTISEL